MKPSRIQRLITNPDPNAEPIFPMKILHDRWHNEVAKDLRRVRLSDLELEYEGESDIEPDIEHDDYDPEAWHPLFLYYAPALVHAPRG